MPRHDADISAARLSRLSLSICIALGLLLPLAATAQETPDTQNQAKVLDKVSVKGVKRDTLGLVPDQPNGSVFGLDKTVAKTPRSVSEVSADLIKNYGMREIGDLVRLVPGALTGSSWGVPGSLDLRGEPADNYFRGFKLIENRNNYPTPIRAAQTVDVVRGPVTPIYGAGKVGGYMNFIPKSALSESSKYMEQAQGEVGLTLGSYGQRVAFGEGGTPFHLGKKEGGVYGYVEREDSHSYYDNLEPKSTLGQVAFNLDLTDRLRLEAGGQYLKSERPQNAGWNRVTQELIDDGTYITGTPANLNTRGDVLYPDNVRANIGPNSAKGTALLDFSCSGYGSCTGFNPNNTATSALLDPGTTHLSHNQTMVSKNDIGRSETYVGYFDLSYFFDNGFTLKQQFFYNKLNHLKYSDNGFTGNYQGDTWEDRVSLIMPVQFGEISTNTVIGASYRDYQMLNRKAQDDQILDRRDLSVGATPNDSFDIGHGGNVSLGNGQYLRNYNVANDSNPVDAGAFLVSDVSWRNWTATLGYRFDHFTVDSTDRALATNGTLVGDANQDGVPDTYSDSKDTHSYNASLAYNFDSGFTLYATRAVAGALQTYQAGDVGVADIRNGSWLQDSHLNEYGVKYASPSGAVYAAVSWYDQDRSYKDENTNSDILVNSKGWEGELRWLATQHMSLGAAVSNSKVREKGNSFTVLNGAEVAKAYGLDPSQVYGYRFFNTGSMLGGAWDRGGVPEWVVSTYGSYTQRLKHGVLIGSLGVMWADSTWADNLKTITLPAYHVWNASLGYDTDRWSALVSINNVFSEKYYTSADTFDSVLVLPSVPRTISVTGTWRF